MKKTLSTLVALGLVFGAFGAVPAEAKKKKPKKVTRVVDFEYTCPCFGLFQFGTATGGDPNLGGGGIAIGGTESYLTGEATDQSGQAVWVRVQQDTDGDGFNNPVAEFCTKTEEPLPIEPGLEARIFVGGVCSDGTPTAPIGGTIKFTLSNMP